MANDSNMKTTVVTGSDNSSVKNTKNKWDVLNEIKLGKSNIINMPYSFGNRADPNDRVFSKTLLKDALLVAIAPGGPNFNVGVLNNQGEDGAGESTIEKYNKFVKKFKDEETSDVLGIIDALLDENVVKLSDFRYYTFKYEWSLYYKYLQTMSYFIWRKMRLDKTKFNYNAMESFDNVNANESIFGYPAITYFADYRGTSISEGLSNSFQSSQLEQFTKGSSQIAREASFLFGFDSGGFNRVGQLSANEKLTEEKGFFTKMYDAVAGGIGSASNALGGYLGFLTDSNPASVILNGAQYMFPEIWSDSTFSKDYTLAFNFHAPYGDPLTIFRKVYFPLLSLLAMTLPRQRGVLDYLAPFLVRVDVPGMFRINCGVITSLTIKKGGDDNLWTSYGLPIQINVNVSVKDLYPNMMISKSFKEMGVNITFADYLDNMANLQMNEYDLTRSLSFWLGQYTNVYSNTKNKLSNKITNMLSNDSNSFRNYLRYFTSGGS